MGVITKPSSVQRAGIVWLQVAGAWQPGAEVPTPSGRLGGSIPQPRPPAQGTARAADSDSAHKTGDFLQGVRSQHIASARVMEGLRLFLCRDISTRLGTDCPRRPCSFMGFTAAISRQTERVSSDGWVVSLSIRDEVLSAESHKIRASQGTKVP